LTLAIAASVCLTGCPREPKPEFEAQPLSGLAPMAVQFTDKTKADEGDITAWSWNFGDGSAAAVDQNPVHTYVASGLYTVTLIVTTEQGPFETTKEDFVNVIASPVPVVDVPAGWFQMGARADDEQAATDMLPRHFVELNQCQAGMYEITNGEFADILNWALEKGYIDPSGGNVTARGQVILALSDATCQIAYTGGRFTPKTRNDQSMADHPVVEVTWYGAVAYCNWLSERTALVPCYNLDTWERIDPWPNGFRLPTEAEWERAAAWDSSNDEVILPDWSQGRHWLYAFSSDAVAANRCNFNQNNPLGLSGAPLTVPVSHYNGINIGTFDSKSPLGCYGMSGNVWEWCQDRWSGYPENDQNNPAGDSGDAGRVSRGGSWASTDPVQCKSAYRVWNLPETHNDKLGFRVARSVQ
jgi:formylglycine-generating enzyme required for sulfatase activity